LVGDSQELKVAAGMSRFDIHAVWDAEAKVWSAHSDAIPGLVTEAETWDVMIERATAAATELLALNNIPHDPQVELRFVAQQTQAVAA
jgi:predicted RNase H-like HicB family nuclease